MSYFCEIIMYAERQPRPKPITEPTTNPTKAEPAMLATTINILSIEETLLQ